MSRAIELAKECGLLSDTGHLYADEIETYFRRAQAMALRDAADEIEAVRDTFWSRYSNWLRRMAAGLEAGK